MRLSGWWWDHLLLLNVSRRHLSITASELSVSPNRGHKEKKQGHHESPPPPPPPPVALPPVSPPPSPPLPLLHCPHLPFLLTSLVLYFLLGSVLQQQEGKWNCFLGSMAGPLRVNFHGARIYQELLHIYNCCVCCVQCQPWWSSYKVRYNTKFTRYSTQRPTLYTKSLSIKPFLLILNKEK